MNDTLDDSFYTYIRDVFLQSTRIAYIKFVSQSISAPSSHQILRGSSIRLVDKRGPIRVVIVTNEVGVRQAVPDHAHEFDDQRTIHHHHVDVHVLIIRADVTQAWTILEVCPEIHNSIPAPQGLLTETAYVLEYDPIQWRVVKCVQGVANAKTLSAIVAWMRSPNDNT